MSGSDHDRIGVLDGLRALAILLVLARHSLKPFWTDFSQPFLPIGSFDAVVILMNGWCGVDLFFVLSGFLITRQLLHGIQRSGHTSRQAVLHFYKKRFFRIAPAYYAVLTLVCLGFFPPYPYPGGMENIGWRYFYHLLFMQDYLPPNICFVFWSLAIEVKFYILAPFIALGLLKIDKVHHRYAVLVAIIAALAVLRLLAALYASDQSGDYETYFLEFRNRFHLTTDGLIAGMLCAKLWDNKNIRERLRRASFANTLFYGGLALFFALTGFALLHDTGIGLFDKAALPLLLAGAFGMMMMGLLGGCAGSRLFEGRIPRFIAMISYSLYLVHIPLLYPIVLTGARIYSNSAHPVLNWLAMLPPFALYCAAAATFMYFIVEKPFIDWAKKR